MSAANFQRALSLVLKSEGGFSDNPKDPGGATNKGITLAAFRAYVKPGGTVHDLRKITDAEVAEVYHKRYWDAVQGDNLPGGIDYAVFDFAVNSGPSRAIEYLQRAIHVAEDGKIGPITLAACAAAPAEVIIAKLCDDRLAFLRGLSTWSTFGKGWTARIASVRADASAMAMPFAPPPPDVPLPEPAPRPTGFAAVVALIFDLIVSIFKRK